MRHQTLDRLRDTALVLPNAPEATPKAQPLTKAERLERWAAALERQGDRQLRTLFEIEHMPRARRRAMRADHSLLTVAFDDPILRADGLAGDTVGDVLTYFRISERALHDVACYCHSGPSRSGRSAAARVRSIATRPATDPRPFVISACIALSLAAGILIV